jgi:hypothetical protein
MRKKSRSIQIRNCPRPFSIAWDAFKADGTLEESNGDVAILVKQTFPNHAELLGVAFLEAKRSYVSSGKYEQIKWPQLNRQNENSSNHRLLLYDHKPVSLNYYVDWTEFFPPKDQREVWAEFAYDFSKPLRDLDTNALVCLSRHAMAYRTRTRKLHELCVPLSYQICMRYFFGHDLDYNPKLVSDVLNGVAEGVDYLLVTHLSYGRDRESSINTIGFNRDAYVQQDM